MIAIRRAECVRGGVEAEAVWHGCRIVVIRVDHKSKPSVDEVLKGVIKKALSMSGGEMRDSFRLDQPTAASQ